MSDFAPDAPLSEVEWRVQGKIDRAGGVQVVAYLDAPTVSRLLDEWVGPSRWRDHYEPTGKPGTMWCHLSIKFDDEWITKEDIGTASDMEADKGLVSDAFKRVAMRKWGVGRNVFALPVLRITRFRQVERQGKDPMAYLTDESHAEIARLLKARGFDEAAEQTRVGVVDSETVDVHETLLSELDGLLVEAEQVGAQGDPAKARSYARQSPEHARKAIETVQQAIEAAAGGGREGPPPAAPDQCDICGATEGIDDHDLTAHRKAQQAQDSEREGGGASTVTDASNGQPPAEPSGDTGEDAGPEPASSPDTREAPWQRAERLGLGPADVMLEIRNIVEDLKREGHDVRPPANRKKIDVGTCDPKILQVFGEFLDLVEQRLGEKVGA